MHELRKFLRLLSERFQATHTPLVAGSLAFTTLLSLVPLLAIALTMMSQLPYFQSLGQGLRVFLLNNLLPDKAGKVIATYAVQFSQKAADLTVVGGLALLITAILLMLTIDRMFNDIWMVRRPRPLWVRVSLYWLAITLGPLVLAGSIAASTYLVAASLGAVNEPQWVRQVVWRSVPAVLFVAFFAFLFHSVPNRRIAWAHAVAGAVVASLGLLALQRLLGLYFSRFPTYTLLYGAFSAIPIFLVWLYTSWLVVLVGALVTAVLPDYLATRRLLPGTVAGRFYAALRLADALAQAQAGGRVASLDLLAHASRQRVEDAEAMLEVMREAGWVAETDSGDWVLVGEARRLDAAQLFARFVLPPEELLQLSLGVPHDERAAIDAVVGRVRSALSGNGASAQMG